MCLAIPGELIQVIESGSPFPTGRVDFGGTVKVVSLAFVPDARVGHYVLVHAGIAITTIDESEAERVFALLEEMGEVDELREASE